MTLRGYQLAGLNWLWLCSRLGVGACLADDMGLGKTIQVLAALLRHTQGSAARPTPPSLLVVPASLIGNWKAEAARFAPSLKLLVAHPSETPQAELEELAADPDAEPARDRPRHHHLQHGVAARVAAEPRLGAG